MTAAKFTPGPWLFSDESQYCPDEPYWIGVAHPKYGFVSHAVVRSGCDEADELGDMKANARLIAAAPELLAAARAALKAIPTPVEWSNKEAHALLSGAIEKATGSAA